MTVICVLEFVGRREGPCVLASDEVRDDIALRRLLNHFGAQSVRDAVLCVISSRMTLGFRQLGRIRIPPLVVAQRGPVCVCVCVCLFIHVWVCMYTCINKHTHGHT